MLKKIISIALILTIDPVYADYIYQEIPVQSKDLDQVSDTYKITVTKGHYKIGNALSESEVKNKLIENCKAHKVFIIATLEILATLFCPVLVPALQEAANMQDDDNKVNQGETTIIIVPVNEMPVLIKQ